MSVPIIAVLVIMGVSLVCMLAAFRPVNPNRVARFALRHGLDLTPHRTASVVAYLSHTRHWRTLGALVAAVIVLLQGLPEQRASLEALPLLAGWLAGALLAELRIHRSAGPLPMDGSTHAEPAPAAAKAFPATGTPLDLDVTTRSVQLTVFDRSAVAWYVPGWFARVPLVLAGLAVLTTATAVTLSKAWTADGDGAPPAGITTRFGEDLGPVVWWGAAVVALGLVVAMANRQIARRRARAGDATSIDRAVRAHAITALTSVGVLLGGLCLVKQFGVLAEGLAGQTLVWANRAGTGCALGVLYLAIVLWRESGPAGRPRFTPALAAVLVTATVAAIGFGVWRDRPPYGPDQVRPVATIRLTDDEHLDADAAAIGVPSPGPMFGGEDARTFVGRLDVTVPADPTTAGSYALLVIDKRLNRVATQVYTERDGMWGGGWGGFDDAWRRYPWLSALAPLQQGDQLSYSNATTAYLDPAERSLPFAGRFQDAAGLRPSDLLVALVFYGPQRQIYWSVQVPVTAS
ncbi:hypothetical protein ACFQZ4_28970 [Catellatospora coxensis]|uniref:Uncharacterized protein n=1 Tax=Catellatospora coxensis TaxID=310354 RepID=A0A8J3P8B9_9ACTN|nr:hypothetical protein [Catellatospora coxensis]GIG07532.1 hypothetical protein Cco03nite_42320 [Catellatospora coxensis]